MEPSVGQKLLNLGGLTKVRGSEEILKLLILPRLLGPESIIIIMVRIITLSITLVVLSFRSGYNQ